MNQALSPELVLIRKKKKKNIVWEIYRYGDMLVKRFIRTAPWPDRRRVWWIEDTALRRLAGLNTPKTYGFVERRRNGALEITYAREFVEGAFINGFASADMGFLARMMARIHQRGVITRDPSLENFIKTPEGTIVFLDFGRSAIFNPKNPVIIDYQAKELARVYCHALKGDMDLFGRFHEMYFQYFPCGRPRRLLMDRITEGWMRRFERKHLCGKGMMRA